MNYTNPNLTADQSNMDGEVINFDIQYGLGQSTLNPSRVGTFHGEFEEFEGKEDADEFYNAVGRRRKKSRGTILDKKERARRRNLREKTKSQKQSRRDTVAQSKAGERKSNAEVQKLMAKQLGVETESDKAMALALAKQSEPTPEKPGMGMGAKIGIGVGVLVVLGVLGFIVYKKMKAKKP